MKSKKPSNMVSRSMRGGILLSVIMMAATFYVLYTYGYFHPQTSWRTGIKAGVTLLSLLIITGAA
ncbi:hypothetical protein D3C73_1489390 [compost metagenome]